MHTVIKPKLVLVFHDDDLNMANNAFDAAAGLLDREIKGGGEEGLSKDRYQALMLSRFYILDLQDHFIRAMGED